MPDFHQGWWPLQAWHHSRSRETLRGLRWVNWSVDLVPRMNQAERSAVVLNNVDGLTFLVADLIAWHGGIWLLIEDENVDIDRVTNPHPKELYLLSLPSVHYWKHTNPKVLSSCNRKSAKNHDQLWVSWNTWQIMWGIVVGGWFLAANSIQISTLVGRWKILRKHVDIKTTRNEALCNCWWTIW